MRAAKVHNAEYQKEESWTTRQFDLYADGSPNVDEHEETTQSQENNFPKAVEEIPLMNNWGKNSSYSHHSERKTF